MDADGAAAILKIKIKTLLIAGDRRLLGFQLFLVFAVDSDLWTGCGH